MLLNLYSQRAMLAQIEASVEFEEAELPEGCELGYFTNQLVNLTAEILLRMRFRSPTCDSTTLRLQF